MTERASRWVFERGGLIALVALVVYAVIAPSHLSTGDNAEFATLGELGGTAHPPGYPLYVLWLRAWSWLPGENPAHVAALATCLLAATMLLVLHAACRAWGAGSFAASVAVVMVGAAPLAVRLHTEAEVFALNGLIGATIVWLAARRGPLKGTARTAALGFVAGLGLANHHTCGLLAPLGLLGVVHGARESERAWLALASAFGALLLGMMPYLYLLVAPDTRGSWGRVEDLGGLLHHFLRMDYGGPGQLGPVDRGGTAVPNLIALVGTLMRTFLWGPLLVGVAALGVRIARGPRSDEQSTTRVDWIMLFASFALVGPLLVARFNLQPDGVHAFIVRRFHLLPAIVFAVPVAYGLQCIAWWWRDRRSATDARSAPWRGTVLAALSMTALIAVTLPRIARARSPAIEQAVQNMLRALPPNAVVITTPDEVHFGMGYLQGAVGERSDVFVITWQLVGLQHERDRIASELGITVRELPEGSEQKLSATVAEQILATGRPLFIDSFQGNVAGSFPVYPEGLLFRVLPRGTKLPSIDELFEINQRLFENYQFGYEFPHRDDVVPAFFHDAYATTWRAIAVGLERAGKHERAEVARRMAQTLAPTP
jgi:hypothetical protein